MPQALLQALRTSLPPVQGFNAGNYARQTPVCSSLLLESTLKVRPYIFIYEPFKSNCRPQWFQSKQLLDILHWLFYSASQPAIPVGFYRKTLYLYCFIKKIAQTCSAFIVVTVELLQPVSDVSCCRRCRQTVNREYHVAANGVVYVTRLWVAL